MKGGWGAMGRDENFLERSGWVIEGKTNMIFLTFFGCGAETDAEIFGDTVTRWLMGCRVM